MDFYTRLGLLAPTRSGGNFRLYQPTDVQRIGAIRRLEAQGIRLDEIAHLLAGRIPEDRTGGTDDLEGPGQTDRLGLEEYLASLDAQIKALRDLPEVPSHGTRGAVLSGLVGRAQVLIASALILSEELLPGAEFIPPL